jgi:hypothetical protein
VRLTATTCGTHDAAGVDTGMDTVVSLHSACGTTPLTCNDDAATCGASDNGLFRDSSITANIPANTVVLIRVSHYITSTPGPFRLNITTSALPCPADINGSGGLTVQDIFDFLAAYFGNLPASDFNNSGSISVQDIFDFLAAYFAGCS